MNLRKKEGISARRKLTETQKKDIDLHEFIIKTLDVWGKNFCLWIDLQELSFMGRYRENSKLVAEVLPEI